MGNDAERYRRYLDGDDDGLREIIDIYYNGLTLYINGIVKDLSATEDILEDTFVKLAVKKYIFKDDGKAGFKTWLYTIARNLAYNYLKRYRSRISDIPIDEYDEPILLSDGTDVEKEFLKNEQKIELRRAMKKLKPDHYQVLYLAYFEDMDIENTARIMGKNKRQITNLLYKAKNSLKSIMEKAGFQYEYI